MFGLLSSWPLKGSRTGMAVIRFMRRETALEGLGIGPSSQIGTRLRRSVRARLL